MSNEATTTQRTDSDRVREGIEACHKLLEAGYSDLHKLKKDELVSARSAINMLQQQANAFLYILTKP
jgi:DUF438 domain-containing protein